MLADVVNRWEKSSWGRKFTVQKRRASLNDFDRFKVMLAKIKVSVLNCFQCLRILSLCLRMLNENVQMDFWLFAEIWCCEAGACKTQEGDHCLTELNIICKSVLFYFGFSN